jgi:hypothetical protein
MKIATVTGTEKMIFVAGQLARDRSRELRLQGRHVRPDPASRGEYQDLP